MSFVFTCPYCFEQMDDTEVHFRSETVNQGELDIIPDEFIDDASLHNHVVDGQKGNYVFETDQAQETMRVYSKEDC